MASRGRRSGAAATVSFLLAPPDDLSRSLYRWDDGVFDAGGYRGGRLAGVDAGHEAEHENGGSADAFHRGRGVFPDALIAPL